MMLSGGSSGMAYGGQTLFVEVVRAMGLHHMNHFTGDHPYVQCEVKHLDRHARTTRATTTPVTMGDTLNPVWGEKLELQPWQPGEDVEFTVYDKGLIGAKTEGKAHLPSHMFCPNGFKGSLEISGLPGALLQIVVQPAGVPFRSSCAGGSTMVGGATTVNQMPAMEYAAPLTTMMPQLSATNMTAAPLISMPTPVASMPSPASAHMQMGTFTTQQAPVMAAQPSMVLEPVAARPMKMNAAAPAQQRMY